MMIMDLHVDSLVDAINEMKYMKEEMKEFTDAMTENLDVEVDDTEINAENQEMNQELNKEVNMNEINIPNKNRIVSKEKREERELEDMFL